MSTTSPLAPINRKMSDDDWNEVLGSIEQQKCILVLGPGAIVNTKGEPLAGILFSKLAKELNMSLEGLTDLPFVLTEKLLTQRGWRKILSDLIDEVYQEQTLHPMYEKLMEISFHLYLSISPDHLLTQAFSEKEYQHEFGYYHYRKNLEIEGQPSSARPWLYNIFGSMDDKESLILTHDQLFDFLFAILSTIKLPIQLRNELAVAQNFIFLGFDFESWYLKILMRLLESHKKEVSYARPWQTNILKADTIDFYTNNFKLDFICDHVSEFVDQLYEKCEENELLRKSVESLSGKESTADTARQLIKEGQIAEAIDFLEPVLEKAEDTDTYNDLLLLSGRFNRTLRKVRQKTITNEEADRVINQITNSLLELTGLIPA
ncbi:MAG: SIR2 family protein [Bacteroidota bacterium]